MMHSSGGLFSNAGRNLRQLGRSPESWLWCVIVLVIYAVIHPTMTGDAGVWWFSNLGLSREGFLEGKVWQVFTYGLLHGAWWHVGLNALFVLLVGSRIEHMAGRSVMMRVMVAGIAAGGAAHLLLGSGLLVGLSGGCLALLLMLTTLSPQSRMFPLPLTGRSLGLGILCAELFLALIHPDLKLPGFSGIGSFLVDHGMGGWFKMGHACHAGGGLAGWIYGRWLLRPRVTLESLRRERARREAG